MVIRTPDSVIQATSQAAESTAASATVVDDLDISPEDEKTLDVKDRPEVQVGAGAP